MYHSTCELNLIIFARWRYFDIIIILILDMLVILRKVWNTQSLFVYSKTATLDPVERLPLPSPAEP